MGENVLLAGLRPRPKGRSLSCSWCGRGGLRRGEAGPAPPSKAQRVARPAGCPAPLSSDDR